MINEIKLKEKERELYTIEMQINIAI